MQVNFPYPGYEQIAPLEIPDANLMGLFVPGSHAHLDERQILAQGFASPIQAPRLREVARSAKRVLVLIDDGTRETPTSRGRSSCRGGTRGSPIERAPSSAKSVRVQLCEPRGARRRVPVELCRRKRCPWQPQC